MPPFLAPIQAKIIAVGLLVALIGGAYAWIYNKGETAGSSAITKAVQEKTIETMDAARARKEKADQEIRSIPYEKRIDELR